MPEQGIFPETLEALIDWISDPGRLGGFRRAFGIIGRCLKQPVGSFDEARRALAGLTEERALWLLDRLAGRMPDLRAIFALNPRRRSGHD